MTELEPEYLARLKALVADGRASLTNAFALEYDAVTVTWPAFEKMASLSRDWQEAEFGKRPDVAWYIDAFGHGFQTAEALEQLAVGMMVTECSSETLAPPRVHSGSRKQRRDPRGFGEELSAVAPGFQGSRAAGGAGAGPAGIRSFRRGGAPAGHPHPRAYLRQRLLACARRFPGQPRQGAQSRR